MKERRSDRWLSILLSILVHGAIIGAFAFGWWHYRTPLVTPQPLAIQATLVGPHSAAVPPLPRVPPAPQPAVPVPAPQPAPQTPPPSSQAQLDAQRQAEQAKAAEEKARAQAEAAQAQQRTEAAAREKAAADAKTHAEALAAAQAQKQAAQQAAAAAKAKAEAKAAAQARIEAEARAKAEAAAEAKAQAEAQVQAQAAAAKVAAARAQQQRQQQLQQQIAAEERLDQLQSNGEAAQYQALIRAKVERAWIRPPTARAGIDCVVHVTQVPGGDVTAVQIVSCNGDDAVRQSIEAAVYRASPLPTPPDPALFERNLTFNFRPSD